MAVVAKKLFQGALSNALQARYTAPASTQGQVTEIWLANNNTTTARTIQVAAHGSAAANMLIYEMSLAANESKIINAHIVLEAAEALYAKQDTGTDVTMTAYGTEET